MVLIVFCVGIIFALASAENPVINSNAADPGVYHDTTTGITFAVTTGGSWDLGGAFPIYQSADGGLTWARDTSSNAGGWAMPADMIPSWAQNSFWAPEIHQVAGAYLLYYTARHAVAGLSIGVAVSQSGTPSGPYALAEESADGPLLRGDSFDEYMNGKYGASNVKYGVIDAHVYKEGDNVWLVFKIDGNCCQTAGGDRIDSEIKVRRMNADGLDFPASGIGSESVAHSYGLIVSDHPSEWNVVEGPWVERHGAYMYLFYSVNYYGNCNYGLGIARASLPNAGVDDTAVVSSLLDDPGQSWSKLQGQLLGSAWNDQNSPWCGPGHNSLVQLANGTTLVFYHSWVRPGPTANGDYNVGLDEVADGRGRMMLRDIVSFDGTDGWPIISGGFPSYTSITHSLVAEGAESNLLSSIPPATVDSVNSTLAECTSSCAVEFEKCVNFHNRAGRDGYSHCRGELDASASQLVEHGCVAACADTASMAALCASSCSSGASPSTTTSLMTGVQTNLPTDTTTSTIGSTSATTMTGAPTNVPTYTGTSTTGSTTATTMTGAPTNVPTDTATSTTGLTMAETTASAISATNARGMWLGPSVTLVVLRALV